MRAAYSLIGYLGLCSSGSLLLGEIRDFYQVLTLVGQRGSKNALNASRGSTPSGENRSFEIPDAKEAGG